MLGKGKVSVQFANLLVLDEASVGQNVAYNSSAFDGLLAPRGYNCSLTACTASGTSRLSVVSRADQFDDFGPATVLYKPAEYAGDVVLQPVRAGVYAVNVFARSAKRVSASGVAFKNSSKGVYFRASADLLESEYTKLTAFASNLSNFNSTCGVLSLLKPLGTVSVSEGAKVEQNGLQALDFSFPTSSEVFEGVVFVVAETEDGQRQLLTGRVANSKQYAAWWGVTICVIVAVGLAVGIILLAFATVKITPSKEYMRYAAQGLIDPDPSEKREEEKRLQREKKAEEAGARKGQKGRKPKQPVDVEEGKPAKLGSAEEETGIIGGDLGNNTEEEIQHNVDSLKAAS